MTERTFPSYHAKEAKTNGRLNALQKFVLRTLAQEYFDLHSIPGSAKRLVNEEIIPDAFSGLPRSMGRDGEVLLSSYNLYVWGERNIPQEGPLLVTPNHYSKGPLRSNWRDFAICSQILKNSGKELSFIARDSMPVPGTNFRLPLSGEAYHLLSSTYGHLLVTPPRFRENGEGSSYHQARKIVKRFIAGDMVGLYPELKGTYEISEGHWLAGYTALAYSRVTDGAKILPVGVFSTGKGKNLFVNFGEPYSSLELEEFRSGSRNNFELKRGYRQAANQMMRKINPLVPPKLRNTQLL